MKLTASTSRKSTPHHSQWLRSPWTTLFSAALGIYIGIFNPAFGNIIAPIGTIYLGLLKMCVFPILVSAVATSVGRLMMSRHAGESIRRILIVFPLGLLGVSLMATTIALITQPGRNLPTATLETLGILVNKSGIDYEISLSGEAVSKGEFDITQVVLSVVPENIFNALSEGQTLKVLIFSIIFGAALGLVREQVTDAFFDWLETIYKTFNKLIQGLTLLLPFGLCSLLATQFSRVSVDVLLAMLKFVILAIMTFLLIYLLSTLIIWRKSGVSLSQTLMALKDSTILALVTTSSLACIPSAISTLSDRLHFKKQTVTLVTPLSITICRFGSVIYFAMATVFVAQLYDKPPTPSTVVITVIGSILAGMATSGVTGVLTLTLLDLVLSPLQLPLEAVLVLFIAIDPLMDPFRTVGIVQTGMAATAMIAPSGEKSNAVTPLPNEAYSFINNISLPEQSLLVSDQKSSSQR
jgi:proton glutamate symport protein